MNRGPDRALENAFPILLVFVGLCMISPVSIAEAEGAVDGAPVAVEPFGGGVYAGGSARRARESPLKVVRESLLGEASSDDWTPLSWRTLLVEGWDRPFVFSPASDSGALRQEWINAANGVFYRQWVVDFVYRNHVGAKGDQYLGSWFIFAPLSRRLEVLFTVPFLDDRRVGDQRAQPPPGTGAGGSSGRTGSGRQGPYHAYFGDLSITPQVLLHETRNTSIMSIMTVRTPTGNDGAGNGQTALGPQLQFWRGLPHRWVVRGAVGSMIPLGATSLRTTVDTNLTVGKSLTLDEVRYFKEFTVYLAANASSSVDRRGPNDTSVTLLPGLRFRLAPDSWFLSGVEMSLAGPGREDYALFFRMVRRY